MIWIVYVAGLVIAGAGILLVAEWMEARERRKLTNYRRAEALQKARAKYIILEYYPREET